MNSTPSATPAMGQASFASSLVARSTNFLVPLVALAAALVAGIALIAAEGQPPFAVYGAVVRGVFVEPRGLSDTATAATPLILIALGYAVAYRARVFTIGAEGQYLVGAVAAVGLVTWAPLRELPSAPLIIIGCLAAVVAGACWSAIAGYLSLRFGASIVISSLMLVYVAQALLQWAIRVGIRDPDSFIPASRQIGAASLPTIPGFGTHLGFLFPLVLGPALAWVLYRHRMGYRVAVLGFNAEALSANEVRAPVVVMVVVLVSGGLAGLAGFVEVAGVNGRLGDAASLGYGFTAIIVALLGRLHPIGVIVAGLCLAGLDIGFEVAARTHDLPSTLVGVIQALVVVFVVIGDAWLERRGRSR